MLNDLLVPSNWSSKLLNFSNSPNVNPAKLSLNVSRTVNSKVLNDETLLSLNQDGKIYVNNILTELENLEKSIEFSNTKLVIDVDKRVKILEFNKLLDKIKELNKKKVFIKVIESNDDI